MRWQFLPVKPDLTSKLINLMAEDERKKQALIVALRALAAGDKSQKDLRDKLTTKGFSAEIIDAALAQLSSEGLLNDAVFAQKLANRILTDKRAGSHRLAFELKKRGIAESIRKDVLSSINPEDQKSQALEIATFKLPSFKDKDPRALRKKLYDFLVRKGYDFQLAQDAAREVVMNSGRHVENEND